MLKFVDYKVKSASFKLADNVASAQNYKIFPKLDCTVRSGGGKVIVVFNVSLSQEPSPTPFEFSLSAYGTFLIAENDLASDYVVKAAEAVFPYVRSSISALTGVGGIPPYILPIIDIKEVVAKGGGSVGGGDKNLN